MSAPIAIDDRTEWLEADGLGGFASGTTRGVRTRRYHALLLAATTPPTGRMVLVNGLDAWVEAPAARDRSISPASATRRACVAPETAPTLESFADEPWPRGPTAWPTAAGSSTSCSCRTGRPSVALRWRLIGRRGAALRSRCGRSSPAATPTRSTTRTRRSGSSGRDVGERRDAGSRTTACRRCTRSRNGSYRAEPQWYRGFLYAEERARGLDDVEDLAAPGVFRWDLAEGDAVLAARRRRRRSPADVDAGATPSADCAARSAPAARGSRRRLERAADAYLVRRGDGQDHRRRLSLVHRLGPRHVHRAARPLPRDRPARRRARRSCSSGPDRSPRACCPTASSTRATRPSTTRSTPRSGTSSPCTSTSTAAEAAGRPAVRARPQARSARAVQAILDGHVRGTRYGIRVDGRRPARRRRAGRAAHLDGREGRRLGRDAAHRQAGRDPGALAQRAPRSPSGSPPSYAALYARGRRALRGALLERRRRLPLRRGGRRSRAGHGRCRRLRPNQILAVGGLPFAAARRATAPAQVVDAVERRLWTPLGLRTLAPGAPGYAPRYEGGVRERDGAYHQGTVWPWLLGPFVEAWVRVRGDGAEARARGPAAVPRAAARAPRRRRARAHLEIADAEPPHTPRGCPFQAWSVGEALRLDRQVLAPAEQPQAARRQRAQPVTPLSRRCRRR